MSSSLPPSSSSSSSSSSSRVLLSSISSKLPDEVARLAERFSHHFTRISTNDRLPSTPKNHPNGYAAVLVGIFPLKGVPHVLLTERTSGLRSHSGETAFPGGKRDDDDVDDDVVTALREAYEEVGLPRDRCSILTRLNFIFSKNQQIVTPIVALIPTPIFPHTNSEIYQENPLGSFEIIPSVDEVAVTYAVPLDIFLRNDFHSSKESTWRNRPFVLHTFNFQTSLYSITPTQTPSKSSATVSQASSSSSSSSSAAAVSSSSVSAFSPIEGSQQQPLRNFKIWGLTAYVCVDAAITGLGEKSQFPFPSRLPPSPKPEQAPSIASPEPLPHQQADSKL